MRAIDVLTDTAIKKYLDSAEKIGQQLAVKGGRLRLWNVWDPTDSVCAGNGKWRAADFANQP
jgi:hypothetical protein